MTTQAPANLVSLMAYYVSQGGVNLGIVGDAPHVAGGTSYHLGRSDLRPGAYSAQTARDKAGLSNYASAVDLGKLGGGYPKLRKFSGWLVNECRHNTPDTRDIREVIWSPEGTTVLRWDRERGVASEPRDGEADVSHRTHTHVSFYRDSRLRDQRPVFRRYFEPAADHVLHIAPHATIRLYSVSSKGCILKVNGKYGVDETWGGKASRADCMAPVHRQTCDGQSGAVTVLVTSGVYRGRYVRVDPPEVTVS